ncbi:MAG: 6-phosphofructokinase [Bacteroidetes bacterium GWA2_31_9]|nr:MAG: 6-phosphofructokinase [Bacteroidetes bacterium GWA2_31_9]
MSKIKRIGVFTSGGDSPGMNAAVRAVVRAGIFNNLEVYGIKHGYSGMIRGEIKELKSSHVSGIIQRGGTILKSARSQEFRTEEGRKFAYDQLKLHGIDAVVAIGGDGTFTGARQFSEEYNIPIVGLPGTIDNDLYGTDFTIGYDTCLNTVVEAIDKIKDTASAHDRLFFIEVMGRDAGFIALNAGIACGAEAVFIPEVQSHTEQLKNYLEEGFRRKKASNIIIVAEGDDAGGAYAIANQVKEDFKEYDTRVTILGHIQRGGTPSAFDRVLASRLGVAAVEALLDDQKSVMVGLVNNQIVHVPFSKTIKQHNPVDVALIKLIDVLNV